MAALAAGPLPGRAAPPANAEHDPALSEWYRGLEQPGSHVGCCSLADCRKPKYRVVGDDYEIFVDDKTYGVEAPNAWVAVPPEKILQHTPNLAGAAVACWRKAYGVMCFVRDTEA